MYLNHNWTNTRRGNIHYNATVFLNLVLKIDNYRLYKDTKILLYLSYFLPAVIYLFNMYSYLLSDMLSNTSIQ